MALIRQRENRQERGAALVEFAIIMPILVMMIFGIVQIGLATYQVQGLHAASRDAARVGSYATTTLDQIESRALASLDSTLLESPPIITVTPDETYPCADADEVVVEIVAQSPYSFPFLENQGLTLRSRAEFVCER